MSSITWVVGGKNTSGVAQIAYSSDGLNYTNASNASAIFGSEVHGIANSGSIWVAGGTPNGGSTSSTGYSYDANTWYASSSGNSILTSINCIAYGDGKFVAIGGGATYVAMYSTDGINWTGTMLNTSWNGWGMGVVYRNSTWVICGGAGAGSTNKMIAYSSNAINWSFVNTTTLSAETRMVDYGASKWVAVGLNAATPTVEVIYATDLSGSWTNSICPYGNRANYVKWGGDRFILNGYSGVYTGSTIYTSSDGVNWSSVTSANISTPAGPINWNNNLWLMGQYNNSTKSLLYSSDNGSTWSACSVPNGNTTWAIAYALPYVSPYYPCFKQGTRILAFRKGREQYVPVETLVKGDLIKTLRSGYKPVSLIGQKTIQNTPDSNIKNRLFRYSQHVCPELFEDLFITGEHCVLVNGIPDKKIKEIREYMGDIYTTEGEYRLPAHLDERADTHGLQGQAIVWHFALEHEDPCANYGVYANGLLVESASEEYLQDYSEIELV